jgi:hypothetical protein
MVETKTITHPFLAGAEVQLKREPGHAVWTPVKVKLSNGRWTRNAREFIFAAGLGVRNWREPELTMINEQ